MNGLYFKQDYRADFRGGVAADGKHVLLDYDCRVAVDNRCMVGADVDLRGLTVHRNWRVQSVYPRLNLKVIDHLDWKYPLFERAVLMSKDSSRLSGDGEGVFRICSLSDLQWTTEYLELLQWDKAGRSLRSN